MRSKPSSTHAWLRRSGSRWRSSGTRRMPATPPRTPSSGSGVTCAGLRDADRFDQWFGRILVNTCRTAARGRGRRWVREVRSPRCPVPAWASTRLPSRGTFARGTTTWLVAPSIRLSVADRTVLVLHYFDELSLAEIAFQSGLPGKNREVPAVHGVARSRASRRGGDVDERPAPSDRRHDQRRHRQSRDERGVDRDLRERVLAATATARQRRGWLVRLEQGLTLSDRRATLTLAAAVLLLLAMAHGAVTVVGRFFEHTTPDSLGTLAYIWQGDLYVAGPAGESPHLVWHDPASASEDLAAHQLAWLNSETVLMHSFATFSGGVHVIDVRTGANRVLDAGTLVRMSSDRRVVAIQTFNQVATPQSQVRLFEIPSGSVVGELPEPISGYPPQWSPEGAPVVGESRTRSTGWMSRLGRRPSSLRGCAAGSARTRRPGQPMAAGSSTSTITSPPQIATATSAAARFWSVSAAADVPTRLTPVLGPEVSPVVSADDRWISYFEEFGRLANEGPDRHRRGRLGAARGHARPAARTCRRRLADPGDPLGPGLRGADVPQPRCDALAHRSGWGSSSIHAPAISEFARQVLP